jgi:hypothetical protein
LGETGAAGKAPDGLNPLNALFGLFSRDIGIDPGTANTLVLVEEKGSPSEPSVVAMNPTRRVLAVGAEAKADGRTDAGQHRGGAPAPGRRHLGLT